MEIETTSQSRKKKSGGILYLILLVLILCGTSGYFYYKYDKLIKNPITAQITAQEEAEKLAKDVGKLMLLPKDESPTVATITDIEKLKDQPFFKNAANDNKVLIYPNAKLGIIYDPKANIIINTGPINFPENQSEVKNTSQALNTRVALRNGTGVNGLTRKVETDIKKIFPEINIVLKDQSKKTDYEKTIVIILNDSATEASNQIAKSLNSQIEKLPEGESKPDGVDVLIILGKDKV